jgi:hypothetical protein
MTKTIRRVLITGFASVIGAGSAVLATPAFATTRWCEDVTCDGADDTCKPFAGDTCYGGPGSAWVNIPGTGTYVCAFGADGDPCCDSEHCTG